jgi:hypothetical protein
MKPGDKATLVGCPYQGNEIQILEPWHAVASRLFYPDVPKILELKIFKTAGSRQSVYGILMYVYDIIWHHMASYGRETAHLWPTSLQVFQERDGMKVMDAGEVGEIVQGGVQVGIGNLSGSSSIHLTYSNLM